MTQTRGLFEGSLFDTKDMKLLTGDAFLEMLRLMERQSKFGHEEEFDKCIAVNMNSMDEEHCVLSYNWGNSFTNDIARGKLGIAKIVSRSSSQWRRLTSAMRSTLTSL